MQLAWIQHPDPRWSHSGSGYSQLPSNHQCSCYKIVNSEWVLNQTLSIMESLQLDKIICVFDQALYVKAAEIVWKHDKFKTITISNHMQSALHNWKTIPRRRMAGFVRRIWCHCRRVCCWCNGWLQIQLCNKTTQSLYMRHWWGFALKGFLHWLELKHAGEVHHFNKVMKSIASLKDGVSQAVFQELLECESCINILQLYQTYLHSVRNQHDLSAFWMSYLDLAEIMLELLRASKRVIGCSILHPSGRWFHGALPMTGSTMPSSCLTTMPQCHDCLLITLKCTLPARWLLSSNWQ